MGNEQFEAARRAEAGYHSNFYQNNELFASGTWMSRPMPMVMDMLERLLTHKTQLRVLDLGCGVGRHTIPIAQRLQQTNSEVIGVDLLDEAVDGLRKYAKEYQVDHMVKAEKADVEHYPIEPDSFDYIAACSCLEHVTQTIEEEKYDEPTQFRCELLRFAAQKQ